MSQSLVNQITLDCLLNKEILEKHLIKQREKRINKEEFKFYRKRIFNLFKEIITNNNLNNLSPDVKYAYDNFITATINYFKVSDNNDLLQEEYKELNNNDTLNNTKEDININPMEADKLIMRKIKMEVNTLDKYVNRKKNIKKDNIILPKHREVDIMSPELKNKGLKNNITNIYEDTKKNKEQENV